MLQFGHLLNNIIFMSYTNLQSGSKSPENSEQSNSSGPSSGPPTSQAQDGMDGKVVQDVVTEGIH